MPTQGCFGTLIYTSTLTDVQADWKNCDAARYMNDFLASVEGKAYGMAMLATRDRDEALDLVQDAMLGFARRYQNKPHADWPPLFYSVLNSRIMDWHRRWAVRRRWLALRQSGDSDALQEVSMADASGLQPPARLQHADAAGRAIRALQALPARQRQTFLLRIWEGLSVAQTARAMGVSQGSVKTHLFRAKVTLQNELGDWHYGP